MEDIQRASIDGVILGVDIKLRAVEKDVYLFFVRGENGDTINEVTDEIDNSITAYLPEDNVKLNYYIISSGNNPEKIKDFLKVKGLEVDYIQIEKNERKDAYDTKIRNHITDNYL